MSAWCLVRVDLVSLCFSGGWRDRLPHVWSPSGGGSNGRLQDRHAQQQLQQHGLQRQDLPRGDALQTHRVQSRGHHADAERRLCVSWEPLSSEHERARALQREGAVSRILSSQHRSALTHRADRQSRPSELDRERFPLAETTQDHLTQVHQHHCLTWTGF